MSTSFSLANNKIISIGGVNHQVKYPTVGQLIEIENKKMLLTGGRYSDYVISGGTKSQEFASDAVDMLAHFSVLIPALAEALNVKSYLDVDALAAKQLVDVYKKEFRPWYNELMKAIHETVEVGTDAAGSNTTN